MCVVHQFYEVITLIHIFLMTYRLDGCMWRSQMLVLSISHSHHFVPISCHISISQYCPSLSRPYLTNHLRIVSVTLVGSWLLGGAGSLGTSTQHSQPYQQNTRTSQQLQPTVLNQVSSSNKIWHNSQQISQKFHSFGYNLSQS